jgi:4'-phosphopantetheinyl transferase EntD
VIETLFPEGVVAQTATEAMWSGPLHPEEEACLSPAAAAKRRREFTAGRVSARAALRRLGLPERPLLVNPDRTPRWPEGVTGSISHCRDYCAVVVAPRSRFAGLGLDVELADPLEPALAARICRPGEVERLAGVRPPGGTNWEKIVFSAKESTYKCYYPLARTFLGFHDVEVTLSPAESAFRAVLVRADAPPAAGARVFHGRFSCDGARVFSGVALPA